MSSPGGALIVPKIENWADEEPDERRIYVLESDAND
jgi:hypothetical protein